MTTTCLCRNEIESVEEMFLCVVFCCYTEHHKLWHCYKVSVFTMYVVCVCAQVNAWNCYFNPKTLWVPDVVPVVLRDQTNKVAWPCKTIVPWHWHQSTQIWSRVYFQFLHHRNNIVTIYSTAHTLIHMYVCACICICMYICIQVGIYSILEANVCVVNIRVIW